MSVPIKLTIEQLEKIRDNGFCYVEVSPLRFIKVTKSDMYIDKEDYKKLFDKDSE